jgi:hypothetical protein
VPRCSDFVDYFGWLGVGSHARLWVGWIKNMSLVCLG